MDTKRFLIILALILSVLTLIPATAGWPMLAVAVLLLCLSMLV